MKRLGVLLILSAAAFACGCASREKPLYVTVVDEAGLPMQGVEVMVTGSVAGNDATYTNAQGVARVQTGMYQNPPQLLNLHKTGYGSRSLPWPETWPATVTFKKGSTFLDLKGGG